MNRIEQACSEAGVKLPALYGVERDGAFFQAVNLPAGVDVMTRWGPQDTARGWKVREEAEVAAEQLGGRVVALEVTEFVLFRQWRAAVAAEKAAEAEEAAARERAIAARRNAKVLGTAFGVAAMIDVPLTDHRGRSGWYVLGEELVYIRESPTGEGNYHYEVEPVNVTRIRPQV